MAVPLLDIKRQHAPIRSELDAAVSTVLDHGLFILGPEVKQLEEDIAKLCGVKHAIGVASGTDALMLALHAVGVGAGDEVITSAFSFFASASIINRLGAKPVFIDIDIDTYNIDPAKLEQAITPMTKAILPIHIFGQCAAMDEINAIAAKHNIRVIEDAAQAIGAEYKGKKAGALGDAGCFSFFPTKNLGCGGDGGMVVTDNDELADKVRILRVHGGKFEYHHEIVGYNSRLDTLQAAILLAKLPYLEKWTDGRRANADFFNEALSGLPLKTPKVIDDVRHIYHQYTIALDKRDDLIKHLQANNIGCKVYYPVPFHLQQCFSDLGYKKGDIPNCEQASNSVVSLPIFGEMTDTERTEVVEVITRFFD